jgi:hypothetical protein
VPTLRRRGSRLGILSIVRLKESAAGAHGVGSTNEAASFAPGHGTNVWVISISVPLALCVVSAIPGDLSDDQLAGALHRKSYSDMLELSDGRIYGCNLSCDRRPHEGLAQGGTSIYVKLR